MTTLLAVLSVPVSLLVAAAPASAYTPPPVSVSAQTVVDAERGNPIQVSCVGADFCLSLDNNGHWTAYRDGQWTDPQSEGARTYIDRLTCLSATLCVGIEDATNIFYRWDGTGWHAVGENPPIRYIYGFSCALDAQAPAGFWCLGLNNGSTAATYDGSWHTVAAPPKATYGQSDLSCTSPSFCLALQGVHVAGTNDTEDLPYVWTGARWRAAVPGSHLSKVTKVRCVSSRFCLVFGAHTTLTWDGQAFSTPVVASRTHELYDMSCVTPTFCEALATVPGAHPGSTLTLRWDGSSWGAGVPITGQDAVQAISCGAVGSCFATDGYDSAGISRLDPDGTWTTTAFDPPSATPSALSCHGPTFCAAVNYLGADVLFHGAAGWGPRVPLFQDADDSHLTGVSCALVVYCVAVGYEQPTPFGDDTAVAVTWNGQAWSRPRTIVAGAYPQSVACGAAGVCVAELTDGRTTVLRHGAWSTPSRAGLPAGGTLHDLTCTSATFCAGVLAPVHGTTPGVWFWDGTTWTGHPAGGSRAVILSCASSTFCETVDNVHRTRTWDGTTWTARASAPFTPTELSCAAAGHCVGVLGSADRTDVAAYTSGRWSVSTTAAPAAFDPPAPVTAVHVELAPRVLSCGTTHQCREVTDLGIETVLTVT